MRITLSTEIPDSIGPQWNALLDRMERPEVFYTHEWALAVSRAYQSSIKPLLFLAHDQDDLIGLVALATDRSRAQTFFLCSTTADYCDFISSENCRAEFVVAVLSELNRLQLPTLVIANLPADSATARILSPAASISGRFAFSRPAYNCARIHLGSPGRRQAALSNTSAQKPIRYSLRRLEKQGLLAAEHITSWEQIQEALPGFIDAHIARFKSTDRQSNLTDPARQVFLRELAYLLSPKGQIVLSRLLCGGRPIAWNYGFQFRGSWFYYQPTFDAEWRQFSPGICLLAKIVEAACDDPSIKLLDLGLGAEEYKQRFSTGARQTLHATVTRSARHRLRVATRYHLASAIKSSAYLNHWVRRLLHRPDSISA